MSRRKAGHGVEVFFADTFFKRAKGMLFGKGARLGECLVLVPCWDIHTFGMRWNIDVAFVNECGVVIKIAKNLPPFHRVRCKGAFAAIERRAEDLLWFDVGDSTGLLNT